MLKSIQRKTPATQYARIAIVASVYNAEYVDGMVEGALGVLTGEVELIRVPGAFEIPLVAAKLARRKRLRPAAVICLGVILRGRTTHAEHVGQSVTQQLAALAVESGIPMDHEVLHAAHVRLPTRKKKENRLIFSPAARRKNIF